MTTLPADHASFSPRLAQAFTALGNALLAQPQNESLRQHIQTGRLSAAAYYTQLRHLAYRLLVLMVAEARGVIPMPGASRGVRQRYQRAYALGREPYLGAQRSAQPRYQRVLTTLDWLRGSPAATAAAIPPLGAFLAPTPMLAALVDCTLPDAALSSFLQALTMTLRSHPLLPQRLADINGDALEYLHLAAQQWQPVVADQARAWQLLPYPGAGTSTAVTHGLAPELLACLLDSTLEPVVQEALTQAEPEAALLHLTICDPACGSGTVLRAAARHLASHLARVRRGEMALALHDVMQHCLYGVDRDAASVDLCRCSLALEVLAPGVTLSCLEHHICCGDSVLGTTPALLAQGIPAGAFRVLADDVPGVVLALRQRNQQERQGQMRFNFAPQPAANPSGRRREPRRRTNPGAPPTAALVPGSEAHAALLAHAWCAAFVCPKTSETLAPITHDTLRVLQVSPEQVSAETRRQITLLATHYGFWHWHLAFPQVFTLAGAEPGQAAEQRLTGWSGGFDVLLGRLPWGTLDDDAQAARRAHLIRYTSSRSQLPIASARQHALHFLGWSRLLVRPTGRIGYLLPAPGVLRARGLLQSLLEQQALAGFATLSNATLLIPWLPRTALLGLVTLTGTQRPQPAAQVVWLARQPAELADPARSVSLQASDLARLNPNTRAYPALRSAPEATLLKTFYNQYPILRSQAVPGPPTTWQVEGGSLLHLKRDAALLRTPQQLEAEGWRFDGERFRQEQSSYLPVYEGAMLEALTCPMPQRLASLPRCWVPAGQVLQRTAHVPGALLQAYTQKRPDAILNVLASWLGGHHLNLGHQVCERAHLTQTYNTMFQGLPPEPGAWVAAPLLAQAWPLTPEDLRLIRQQHDVLLLARQLITQRSPDWLVSWRERLDASYAVHATVVPRAGLAQTAPWLRFTTPDAPLAGCLVANLTSLVVAFCVRQKSLGTRLTPAMLYELPVIPPSTYAAPCPWESACTLQDWLMPRVLALLYTGPGLAPWARACGYEGAPFQEEADSRAWYRSEVEAAYCHLYDCSRADVLMLLDTMPRARQAALSEDGVWPMGERLLQSYDALHQVRCQGTAYRPQVEPPGRAVGVSGAPLALPRPGRGNRLQPLVEPRPEERYKTCVPLFDLQTVVNACAEGYDSEPETWIAVPSGRSVRPGMFVARMIGSAMAPQIPDRAYCLFERQGEGNPSRFQGRIVLVQHPDINDPDIDGPYTVRRYMQEHSGSARRTPPTALSRLLPLHADYPPIVLTWPQSEPPRVIAEFLAVLEEDALAP